MKYIITILLLTFPIYIIGQTLSVSDFYLDEHDLTAINEATKFVDDNGDICALIKVETTEKGFYFNGGTVGVAKIDDNHHSEIWVYVPAGLRRITISHDKLGMLRNYEFPISLQMGRTYVMKLISGSVETVVKQKSNQQFFVLTYKPEDAMVEIDGTIVEGSNGTVSQKLSVGRHEYRVSSTDYHPEVGTVTIGQEKAYASVELKPAFGWIEVVGQKGASVYIDNKKVGEVPMKSEPIASGSHDVRVSKDLYLPFRQQVIVSDDRVTKVEARLMANYVTVTLNVANDAEIWVNDEKKGNGSVSIDLAPGEYTFETRKEHYRAQSVVRNITMSSGGEIELPAPVAITGTIEVDVSPIGAKVFLDGKQVGESPLLLENILVGEHSVKLTATNMQDEVRNVVVEDGKSVVIKKSMIKFVGEIAMGITLDLTNENDAKWYAMDLDSLYALAKDSEDSVVSARMLAIGAYRGHAKSQNMLGNSYYSGEGVTQYYYEAAKWYRKSAEQGYHWGQYNLGSCYYNGKGVKQDYHEAVKWFKLAAAQNNNSAQNYIGNCYYNGKGVEQSYERAVEWYQKSASQGNTLAQNNLGDCYYDGKGVEQNFEKAVEWYQKSANQGYSWAQNNLGNCYYNGKGIEQSFDKAVVWYKKSAEQGCDYGQFNYGNLYYKGEGVEKDYNVAFIWFIKAAEQNNKNGQNAIGNCYFRGHGIPLNYTEAVKWYRKAAEQGSSNSQQHLGMCYYNGYGVKQNFTEAVKWYRKAAEQGHIYAQYDLGFCYEKGNGVNKDISEAIKWYKKAAEQGNEQAIKRLNALNK